MGCAPHAAEQNHELLRQLRNRCMANTKRRSYVLTCAHGARFDYTVTKCATAYVSRAQSVFEQFANHRCSL